MPCRLTSPTLAGSMVTDKNYAVGAAEREGPAFKPNVLRLFDFARTVWPFPGILDGLPPRWGYRGACLVIRNSLSQSAPARAVAGNGRITTTMCALAMRGPGDRQNFQRGDGPARSPVVLDHYGRRTAATNGAGLHNYAGGSDGCVQAGVVNWLIIGKRSRGEAND
jgi:hypothetical protein